jgi:hypothetical protein
MNYAQAISAFAHALNHEDDTDQPPAASGLHFAHRMWHYRANCRLNRIAALQATFSTVEQLLGTDFFRAMAREYVDSTPATSANLHEMGDDFPGFIAQFAPAAALPYLPDVASSIGRAGKPGRRPTYQSWPPINWLLSPVTTLPATVCSCTRPCSWWPRPAGPSPTFWPCTMVAQAPIWTLAGRKS